MPILRLVDVTVCGLQWPDVGGIKRPRYMRGNVMAKRASAGLDFGALMKLRSEVEDRLQTYHSVLEQQLARFADVITSGTKRRGRPPRTKREHPLLFPLNRL